METNNNPPKQETSTMQTNNNNSLITTFMEITSSSSDEALFFLESHNFDLDSAISSFFDSSSAAAVPAPTAAATATAVDDVAADFVSPQTSPSSLSPSSSPSRSRSHSPPPSSQYNLRSRTRGGGGGGRSSTRRSGVGGVRTLADLNDDEIDGDDDDSENESDRPPRYFAGGHKSGMLVQDPSKDNTVDAIFDQARRAGATEGPADIYQPSSSSRSFVGTARLLSGETVSSSPLEVPPEVVTHTITFWQNGFTVDDGPLRMFNDEANASFLESITKSECPKELQPADRRTKVHVSLMRKNENCPEQEKRQVSFQGVGRTLGSSSSSHSEPSVAAAATALSTAPSPVMGLVVDDKLPSTSIQLRLADGTRMVSRFNYQHTIRDIHAFIDASRPARQGTYMLQMMGFPPKQLTDLDQTIEQAGLANSVVIQKF